MRDGSILTRVVRGTLLASLITAVSLSAAAAAISLWLWRTHEGRMLRQTLDALIAAADREAIEEGWPLERAAPEAVRESGVTGYRIEIWKGKRLLAANLPGATLGPDLGDESSTSWIVVGRALDDRLRLVVAAPNRGGEALRVFGWSLLLAIPLCLVVALLIGRFVGRRATRPLIEFKARIAGARPFQLLPSAELKGAPLEVRQLDEAFRALWRGLDEALSRELEFAANASHELRTPLTRIRLLAENARAEVGPEAKAQLDQLTTEVDRMVRLVESLLVLARDVSAGLSAGEVVNVADTARAAITRLLDADRVRPTSLPDEALVRGDGDLLDIAVENLVDNGGRFGDPDQTVGATLSTGGGQVRLTITSPGARVPEAQRELLFERFYRSPEARVAKRGHGLGLPLARHIARLHGGDVTCVSGPDQDAAFELRLPAWTALRMDSATIMGRR